MGVVTLRNAVIKTILGLTKGRADEFHQKQKTQPSRSTEGNNLAQLQSAVRVSRGVV